MISLILCEHLYFTKPVSMLNYLYVELVSKLMYLRFVFLGATKIRLEACPTFPNFLSVCGGISGITSRYLSSPYICMKNVISTFYNLQN